MLRLAFAFVLVNTMATTQQVVVVGNSQHDAITATKDGLTLAAGHFTVVDFVESVAGFLCRNYLYDYDELSKAPGFQLQRGLSLDAMGSEELLLALLASRGFVALPLDELRGVYEIVGLGSPQRAMPLAPVPWRAVDDILRRPRLRELIMTAMPVEHLDAQVLANALRAHFSLQGMWTPGVPTASAAGPHLLLLYGYRDQLAQVLLVVQQLDRLSAPSATTAEDPVLKRLAALEQEVADLRAQLQQRSRGK